MGILPGSHRPLYPSIEWRTNSRADVQEAALRPEGSKRIRFNLAVRRYWL